MWAHVWASGNRFLPAHSLIQHHSLRGNSVPPRRPVPPPRSGAGLGCECGVLCSGREQGRDSRREDEGLSRSSC